MIGIRKMAQEYVDVHSLPAASDPITVAEYNATWAAISRRTECDRENPGPDIQIARAYLAECEAHEQTREMLNDAVAFLHAVLDEGCEECGGCGITFASLYDVGVECPACAGKIRHFLTSIGSGDEVKQNACKMI